ncbi:MAG: glycoside hydrolase family 3 C-terminal domain-containing protein [Clostridia bacterium]|nr:glycoside hydrolase family 3 C-terminal domain-containing protein [Clostridia bacterium]
MDIEELLRQLSLDEKAALVAGHDFMYTNAVPRLGIKSIEMRDGPHGLRKQEGNAADNGVSTSLPSTSFPTAVTMASGWNTENAEKVGGAIADECRHYGVNVVLGPGLNIKRNPRCGRNFEYFSEDPHLAGEMAAAEVAGIQKKGVGACVKHFALNNTENFRFMGNSVCDERAMREVYLKAFEKVVRAAKPYAVMSAYNRVNGTFCCENKFLLNDVLRGEWGFDGLVMTDWGGMHDRVLSLKAGLDLEMPGDTNICRRQILDGVKSGTLSEEDLNKAVKNVLKLVQKCEGVERAEADFAAHHALAAEVAEDCAVLLKNDDSVLPLAKGEKLAVVGDLFEKMRYQGAGSSMINPTFDTTPKDAFERAGVDFGFARGYLEAEFKPDGKLVEEAVNLCKVYDKILLFAGLTDYAESEGGDRENLRLPENQLALISALSKLNKKIILVLFGGAVTELPFEPQTAAILNMFLPGQNGGTAVYNLLFGKKNPCGKLSESWVNSYAEVPFGGQYAAGNDEIYRESVFVGYRYYQSNGVAVRYPFGYGLSYTKFTVSDLTVKKEGGKITAKCKVKNTGERYGAEVVQLYVKYPETDLFKPEKQLKAFKKVYLQAGESSECELEFDLDDLKYYNVAEKRWVLEDGTYSVQICSDCLTVLLDAPLKLEGERLPCPYPEEVNKIYSSGDISGVTDKIFTEMSGLQVPEQPRIKPITMESRFTDFKTTPLGKLLFKIVMAVASKQLKKAKEMPAGSARDNAIKGAEFTIKILESNCMRSMTMCAPTRLQNNVAEGLVAISNGHILRGIKLCCSKIKVPKLPSNTK